MNKTVCYCAGKTQITVRGQKRVRNPCNGAIVSYKTFARHNLSDAVINDADDQNGDSMEMEEFHSTKRKFVHINISMLIYIRTHVYVYIYIYKYIYAWNFKLSFLLANIK